MISIYAAARYFIEHFGKDATDTATAILLLVWFVAVLVGLVYPQAIVFWSNEKSRKRVLALSIWTFSLLFVLSTPGSAIDILYTLASLFLIFIPLALIFPWIVTPWSSRTSRKSVVGMCVLIMVVLATAIDILGEHAPVDPRYALTEEEFESASPGRRIMFLAASELKGESTSIKDMAVTGHSSGGYVVEINLYEGSYDLPFLQKFTLSIKMTNIYKAVYTSGYNIREAGISVYIPSQGGEDELLWKTVDDESEARRTNWNEQYPTCTGPQYGLDLDKHTVYENVKME